MANGIKINKGVEFIYTATSDTNLQNTSYPAIYVSQETFDSVNNPRTAWTRIPFGDSITVTDGSTMYLYANFDATMAELSM